jgi:hypothetical protein
VKYKEIEEPNTDGTHFEFAIGVFFEKAKTTHVFLTCAFGHLKRITLFAPPKLSR